jgi:hydroxypyruvate isomerase
MNIDYLADKERKEQLDAVLLSYNLTSTVHFPTRVQNQSSTAVDNIFIDNYTLDLDQPHQQTRHSTDR